MWLWCHRLAIKEIEDGHEAVQLLSELLGVDPNGGWRLSQYGPAVSESPVAGREIVPAVPKAEGVQVK